MNKSAPRTLGISCIVAAVLLVAAIFAAIIAAVVTIDLVRQPEPITSFARSERNFDDYERELEAVLMQHGLTLQRDDRVLSDDYFGDLPFEARDYFVYLSNYSRIRITFSNVDGSEWIAISYSVVMSEKNQFLNIDKANLILELFNSISRDPIPVDELSGFLQRLEQINRRNNIDHMSQPTFREDISPAEVEEHLQSLENNPLDGKIIIKRTIDFYCRHNGATYLLVALSEEEELFGGLFSMSGRGFGVQRPIHEWWRW